MPRLMIEPSKLEGKIEAQPSKSYTHRAFSVCLLADGESNVSNPLWSYDTQATIRAVQELGARVRREKNFSKIFGTGGNIKPKRKRINVGNSGTTLRFMSGIGALSKEPILLSGDKFILTRPMGPLVESLSDLGAKAKCKGHGGRPPVMIKGRIKGGETRITGSVSSQFISSLLFVSPYSESGVDITVEGEPISKPYIRMTLEILKFAEAKINSNSTLTEFEIPGGQIFEPIDYEIPGDFSSAAFILGAAAMTGSSIEIENLDPKDVQGDRKILELLERVGADVKIREKTIEITGGNSLERIDADCSDIPDLVPILAVLGAGADGWTNLTNVSHLQFKEIDRLKALKAELRKTGAKVKVKENQLKIHGTGQLKAAKFQSYGDHRMAMALAVAGLGARGKSTVEGAESVGVSYPNFVKDMRRIGAHIEFEPNS